MKFTLSSTALNQKLQALSKVISSKNSLAILGDFLFDVSGDQLRITASDSENVLNTQLSINESDGELRFCIGSHDLLEGLKSFSEQPLTFEVSLEESTARIQYQNGVFSLPVESADEYPQTQEMDDTATEIVVSSQLLADNINRSIFATAQDEMRPVMNGIFFDLTPECLALVASDGHKLVRNKMFAVKSETPTSFILPKKPAQLLKGLLTGEGDVIIRFNERNAEINFSDGKLTCRLIEGRYPNYNSVIPQNNPNEITVDRVALLSAMKRVQPFASGSSDLIRFHVEQGLLQLDAEDFDFAKTAQERIACDYNGQPMSIGFKGSSFIEILNNLSSSDVLIQLSDPSRAGIVTPAEQPENQDVLMLMMPMLLND